MGCPASTETVNATPSGTQLFHVAVIMDGNGRWALNRGMPRPVGHRRGAECLRTILKAVPDFGISHFTIYAFSTENWKRSTQEVIALMGLFERYFRNETSELNAAGVQVRFIGDRDRLSSRLKAVMRNLETITAGNTRMVLNIAINYGGQDEILRACRRLLHDVSSGQLDPEKLTNDDFSARLDLMEQPSPDLIIRTGGHMRVSNFLLWHAAYSEYVFTETLWPDFTVDELHRIILRFNGQQRNFGAV